MRLWSLHPNYLDGKGLVALWREALLAKHVLEGKTTGYKNHPQLDRFKACASPVDAIHVYLSHVFLAAKDRGYNFNSEKFNASKSHSKIIVTDGQLAFEVEHLKRKLATRDPNKLREIENVQTFKAHPMFALEKGDIAEWEIL